MLPCLRFEKSPAVLLASVPESTNVVIDNFPAIWILFLKCVSKEIQKKLLVTDSEKIKTSLFYNTVYSDNVTSVQQAKTE